MLAKKGDFSCHTLEMSWIVRSVDLQKQIAITTAATAVGPSFVGIVATPNLGATKFAEVSASSGIGQQVDGRSLSTVWIPEKVCYLPSLGYAIRLVLGISSQTLPPSRAGTRRPNKLNSLSAIPKSMRLLYTSESMPTLTWAL